MNRKIEEQLVGNGNIIEAARRAGKSLSRPDRNIIDRVRARAIHEHGYGWTMINGLEMEGERGRRGHKAFPIEAEFRGLQEMEMWGLTVRLYNIVGDHILNGSTVGVVTLIHNGIMPLDISLPRIGYEYVKENFITAWWYTLSLWQVIKIKMGVRS